MTDHDEKQVPPATDAPEAAPNTASESRAGAGPSNGKPAAPAAPPRGPSWLAILTVVVLLGLVLWIGVNWGEPIRKGIEQAASFVGIGHDHAKHAVSDESGTYYTCGMHPWVILPKPGSCPVCHMDLVPLDPSKFTGEVAIDPIVVQNIGVRVAAVVQGPLTRRIRTIGTVDYDETAVRDVNIKVPGWIETLYVDYLGAPVKKGQPLFDFYSPDLYAAQEEYLLALKNRDTIGAEFVPDAARSAKELLESARTRLLYFDITSQQVEALEKRGQPTKTLAILSPHEGVVIDKHANEGMKVDQGMRVYRIADLAKVWVMVTLYEYQLPFVQRGQSAVMTLPYVPGQNFEGKVIYIYPYLDKQTREVQVRLEFENPVMLLKPGMFVNVELESTLADDRTLAPREAIIDTGERQVAFVSLGKGRFEPRQVRTGPETADGMVAIFDGVKPGEMVVVSGQFLIDSEAKIREALAKMIRGQPAAVSGMSELSQLPQAASSALGELLDNYFAIGQRLAGDSLDDVAAPARQIVEAMDALLDVSIPVDAHFWRKHEEAATIRGKALELASAQALEKARLLFADLSIALDKLVRATGVPPSFGRTVQELHCPMYRDGQGGTIWLQPGGDVRNPYYGSSMLGCFDKRITMPETGP